MEKVKQITLDLDSVAAKLSGDYKKSLVSLLQDDPDFIQDYATDFNEDRYYNLDRLDDYGVLVVDDQEDICLRIEDSLNEQKDKRDINTIKSCLASLLWSKYTAVHATEDPYPISEDSFFATVKKTITKDDFEISYRNLV